MNKYNLSIIVPTFNLENEIDKTFESIKKQTIGFENIEVIFVDDESTDSTLTILKNYSNEYDNVKIFSSDENSGYAGKPRNIGIENATSDYILFLDGDDQLLLNACEVLYEKIQYYNTDMIIGGHINVYENGVCQHYPPLLNNNESYFKNTLNAQLLNINPAISAKLFNKSILIKNNIKFPEKIPGEDLVFLLESMINSESILTLNNFYVYYRNLNNDSVTLNLTEDYFYGLIEAYILVCDLFEKYAVNENIQEIVLHNHLSFFTERVMKAHFSNEFYDNDLERVFKSDLFDKLSHKSIFENNYNFKLYFERIKMGEYNNRDILNNIYQNFNFDCEIVSDLKYVKEEISKLNIKPNKINEDNIYLKKINKQLQKENKELNQELDEIKSSKLWRLKNKI